MTDSEENLNILPEIRETKNKWYDLITNLLIEKNKKSHGAGEVTISNHELIGICAALIDVLGAIYLNFYKGANMDLKLEYMEELKDYLENLFSGTLDNITEDIKNGKLDD